MKFIKTIWNKTFGNSIPIEDAVLKTRREAVRLEQKIIQIARKGRTDKNETLSTLFKPLHNETTYISKFESSKIAGINKSSWIRIYAIRIEVNLFLVTGGAIKLTKTMNDRKHLLKELEKLNITKAFLSDENNIDDFPIFELFI